MQTEGLCQHIGCQRCESMEKPIVVVTPGKMESRRQTVCFCTSCWQFTDKHHGKDKVMDMVFFRNMNPDMGKFYRALPYTEEEHPRWIRGQVTDHELDHFRRDRLQLRKGGGPDKCVNELVRSLTAKELEIIRELANQALRNAKGAKILTDEVLNCTIRLLHKGGDTSNKPSDWRPIGLLNVCIQLVHHVINYRLTVITEAETSSIWAKTVEEKEEELISTNSSSTGSRVRRKA
jgi:hypothetical protein